MNFDPSHLVWQMIDQARFIREFGPHMLHVHAKDLMIDRDGLYERGILSAGHRLAGAAHARPRRGRLARASSRASTAPATTARSIIEHEDRRVRRQRRSGEARLPAGPRRASPVTSNDGGGRTDQRLTSTWEERKFPCRILTMLPLLAGAALACLGCPAVAAKELHDRRLQHRAGQWLARGDDLRDQGAGARLGQGRQAQHRPPQHRRRRPARGHPQPDQRRGRRHRRQPRRSGRHQRRARGSDRQGHRRRRRRPGGDRAVGLHHLQQPGGIRLSRRQVAVRADGRQGRRRLHARRGRRFGRQRPRQGLQEGARRVPRTSRSRRRSSPAGSRTRASSRSSTSSPPARRSTASGPRASTTSSSTRWSSPGADGAGRRRRQCRLRRPAQLGQGPGRARPSPTPARSAAPA